MKQQDIAKIRTALESDIRRVKSYLEVCIEKDKPMFQKQLQSLNAALAATYEGKEAQ